MNLCNRSDEEVQQILLSQFTDDEVEIVYLNLDKFGDAYTEVSPETFNDKNSHDLKTQSDLFNPDNDLNKQRHHSSRFSGGSIRRKMSLSSIAAMWSK